MIVIIASAASALDHVGCTSGNASTNRRRKTGTDSGRQGARVRDGLPRRADPGPAGARLGADQPRGRPGLAAEGVARARSAAGPRADEVLRGLEARAEPDGLRGPELAARAGGRDPA